MPYLFAHFDVISEALALTPVGLFTDVDGTISEMAPTPAEAVVSAVCRESLIFLAGKLALVAAVSGRSVADTRRLVGVDGMVYVGNHGYERWDAGKVTDWPGVEGYPERITSLLDEFGRRVSIDGIVVENKGPTASIHYRRCADHEAARRAILSEVAGLAQESGIMVSRGKLVVELRPPLDVTKGSGVLSLIEERGLRGAIYLGDDLTDADVFVAFHEAGVSFRGVAVAVVGAEAPPEVEQEADLTLNGVADVERFLRRVAAEVADRPAS